MSELVSIIVPTFNRAHLIEATIASLLQQTYPAIEIIVVDDHSIDNTATLIDRLTQKDQRIKFYQRPATKPKGANACRNYGLELAKGEYVKWIDSDDLLSPNAIEHQWRKLQTEKADLCICKTSIFSDQKQLASIKNWGNITKPFTPKGFMVDGLRFHTCSGLWKKTFFEGVSPWDEAQMNAQEWLMHFQQLCRGVKVALCDEYLSFARYHDANMSNKKNKKGKYYYHECTARIKAISFAKRNKIKSPQLYHHATKQLFWYFLFVVYKGAPLLAFRLIPSLLCNIPHLLPPFKKEAEA